MQVLGLYDIDMDIKVNDLKEVTSSSVYSSTNQYHPNGLFSEEIFGQTEDERKYRCGYIKLPIHVFNPEIAKTIITRSGGIIRKLAYAETRCDLVDGVLIENENGKYCGIRDLYHIWDSLNIGKILTTKKDMNIDILIKTPKRLLFIDKLLVLPPAMRPIGMKNGKVVKSELNSYYRKLLGYKSVTAHTTASIHKVDNSIQDTIIDFYTYIHKHVATKYGYFQKNLLAKNSLWTCRNVISAPSYNSSKPEVGLWTTGYPLMSCVSMFNPFVKFHMKQFLSYDNLCSFHTNPDEIRRDYIENIYDDKMIGDLLTIFMDNPGSRFRILYMDPDNKQPIMFNALNTKTNEPMSRPLTLTDVVYLCCYEAIVVPNRHVYTVRYPIGKLLGSMFARVHILSTIRTMQIQFQDREYPTYPIIDPNMSHMQTSTQFIDVMNIPNSRLRNLGADYDGDTVKSTGLWSDEANEQAERLMRSKIYLMKTSLDTAFPIELECLQGLYGLTKMD